MTAPVVATLDFETFAIGERPEAYPPIPVGCAVEVPGLKPFYLAWGHPTGNNTDPETARRKIRQVWDSDLPLLFHNAKFDYEVATRWLRMPPVPWQRLHDTLYLIFLQNPDRATLALKPVAEEVLHLKPHERDKVRAWLIDQHICAKNDKKWGRFIAQAPGDIVGEYSIGDVTRTRRLFERYYQEVVVRRGMGGAYDRERRLMPHLLASEQRGMHVDRKRLEHDVPLYEGALESVDIWLRKRLRTRNLSVDSNEELAEALLRAGVADEEYWERTPTGQLSTAKDALTAAITVPSIAGALLYRGTLATCVRTFMRPWLNTARETKGLIYTSWNQVRNDYHSSGANKGARTARIQSTPNFQNIPTVLEEKKDLIAGLKAMSKISYLQALLAGAPIPQVRGYIVPARGMVLLNRDYNQQELRILAHYEEGELLAKYKEDPWLDVHAYIQTVISDILRERIERKPIKVLNFGMLYGMGIGKLAYGMDLEVEVAKRIKKAHARGFPGIPALMKKMKDRAKAGEPIRTWGGREYYCEPPRKVNGIMREFDYKLLNRLIQGSAADNTKAAMINYAERTENGFLLLSVHDELMSETEKAYRVPEMRLLRDAMLDVKFDVPMLSEGRWSATRWTEMHALPRGE